MIGSVNDENVYAGWQGVVRVSRGDVNCEGEGDLG